MIVIIALLLYLAGMVLTAVGSRLAGRCATWCCALIGLPMWVVSGTVVGLCVVLPQLMLAFLASGLSITALAVGSALAGAVADLGLVLALCLIRPGGMTTDRKEFTHKCGILIAACAVLLVFVRGGDLSYTGTGLLMALFVVFILENITCCYRFTFREELHPMDTTGSVPESSYGAEYTTVRFPAMSIANSLRNLCGTILGIAVLAGGALMLLFGAVLAANVTGTIQALWAASLISLGFCLPLLAEVFHHPLNSIWRRFAERCRIYPPQVLPMQILNNAILSITLVLPISSLMFRGRIPIGAQYRRYEVPACLTLGLILVLPVLLRKRLYRWQGFVCLAFYAVYLVAVLFVPISGA